MKVLPFNPKRANYSEAGVPILSASQVEATATAVLEQYCPAVCKHPVFSPVAEIIQGLGARTGLRFAMLDLGTRGGKQILGAVSFGRKMLLLDRSLEDSRERQFRFTAAHEIGHWVIHRHRPLKLGNPDESQSDDIDLSDDKETVLRLDTRTPRDWLEWQANVFAASLVMPRSTFQVAVERAQRTIGITKNFGLVYLGKDHHSFKDYSQTVSLVAQTYDVSRSSVEVRLRTFELLREIRR